MALCDDRAPVRLVVTGVDKRRGRGTARSPSPVKKVALERGLTVVHDLGEVMDVVRSLQGNVLGVVVAYGHLIPEEILEAMTLVNLHFSLLPRWRGAAPVERAILAGDRETGVCLMRVREELDAGEVYAVRTIPISEDDTLEDLRHELNRVGVPLVVQACREGLADATPQEGEPLYARKITAKDLYLSWGSAVDVSRQVRVGGAYGHLDGRRVRVWKCARADKASNGRTRGEVWRADGRVFVACGEGVIELISVQPEGKGQMAASAWWNGMRSSESVRFES